MDRTSAGIADTGQQRTGVMRRCWLVACALLTSTPAFADPAALIDGCNQQARYALIQAPIIFDSAQIPVPSSATPVIQRLAEIALQCPHANVLVKGHTDNRGDTQDNLALSLARAESVANALAAAGISATRIRAEGLGSREPVVDNATRSGRRKNRRITVSFAAADRRPAN